METQDYNLLSYIVHDMANIPRIWLDFTVVYNTVLQ